MDINCPRCGEPWELDFVNHEMSAAERQALLKGEGCRSECRSHPASDSPRATAATAVLELLGDDLDGAAAMLEDFGLTG
jgi:hypothetical protein